MIIKIAMAICVLSKIARINGNAKYPVLPVPAAKPKRFTRLSFQKHLAKSSPATAMNDATKNALKENLR